VQASPSLRPLRRLGPAACAAVAAALLTTPLPSRSDNGKFDFPSGRITYKFSAGNVSGTSVLVWTENGKRFRQDTSGTSKQSAKGPQKIVSWTIGDGNNIYMHQSTMGKQVMRIPLPKTGTSPISAPGGKTVGKGTVLGRPCEIRQVGPGKVWVWKGIALKNEQTGGGATMVMEATAIQTPARNAPELFKVPAGYTIKDSTVPAHGTNMPPGR
jgi:hypothetical protein